MQTLQALSCFRSQSTCFALVLFSGFGISWDWITAQYFMMGGHPQQWRQGVCRMVRLVWTVFWVPPQVSLGTSDMQTPRFRGADLPGRKGREMEEVGGLCIVDWHTCEEKRQDGVQEAEPAAPAQRWENPGRADGHLWVKQNFKSQEIYNPWHVIHAQMLVINIQMSKTRPTK